MKNIALIAGATALVSLACSIGAAEWPAPYRPFSGKYTIYSGELGDQQAPTRNERKVSFIIDGGPAKEMFDSMYPDDKETCGSEGTRARTRGNVWCTYQQARGYKCYFGFDLRTGKSIGGGIC
jgi:hypothetical protein